MTAKKNVMMVHKLEPSPHWSAKHGKASQVSDSQLTNAQLIQAFRTMYLSRNLVAATSPLGTSATCRLPQTTG